MSRRWWGLGIGLLVSSAGAMPTAAGVQPGDVLITVTVTLEERGSKTHLV